MKINVKPTPACQHCKIKAAIRPRTLCWTCYYTPGVRERYPVSLPFGHRGVGNFSGNAPLPDVATNARPGTPEKVAVMSHRAAMSQALWHPGDAAGDPLPMPAEGFLAADFANAAPDTAD